MIRKQLYILVLLLFPLSVSAQLQMYLKGVEEEEVISNDTLLLDSFPGAELALSLRSLVGDSIDSDIVQVLRLSDSTFNTFTAAEIADGTLETWVGSTDGKVSKWYSQLNDYEAYQNDTSAMPLLVDEGVVVEENGKPTLRFDGVNDFLRIDDAANIRPSTLTVFFLMTNDDVSTSYALGCGNVNTLSNINWYIFTGTSSTIFQTENENLSGSSITGQNIISLWGDHGATDATLRINSIEESNSTTARIGIDNTSGVRIGCSFQSTYHSYFLDGNIQEVILYGSDQSGNQEEIENNIDTYYSVY